MTHSAEWNLPSASLRSHRCTPLLWLPISLCLQCFSESHADNTKKTSSDEGTGNDPGAASVMGVNGEHTSIQMSGFERHLLEAVLKEPLIPMQSLRGVFPAASEYYTDTAVFEMSVRVATDAASFVASPWANLEAHKNTTAVVVVLNSHDHDLCRTLDAVKMVFQWYFKETMCRCLVLDPTADVEADMSQHMFLPVRTGVPVKEVAQYLLREVALSVVQQVNTDIIRLKSPSEGASAPGLSSFDDSGILSSGSSNVDGNGTIRKHVLESRLAKRKGDLLLQLGALDAALIAYSKSLVLSDAMVSSATLESLAAARYLQNAPLFSIRSAAEALFSSLQSDEMLWNDTLSSTLDDVENVVANVQTGQQKAFSLLRQNLLPFSISKKLSKEVNEALLAQSENFRRLLGSIRKAFSPDLNDSAINVREIGKSASSTFAQIIRISFLELHLFLHEALQQQRSNSGKQGVIFREREVETHLKRAELFAEEGDRRAFLESLTVLKAVARNLSDLTHQRIRERIPYLCILCGCWRKAIYYLLEAAEAERQAKGHGTAIRLLVRACQVAGIHLPGIEFQSQLAELATTSPLRKEISTSGGAEAEGTSVGCRVQRSQDVLLLMELLHVVTESGEDNGMRGMVASVLLFEYHPFLQRETQQSLMDIIERSNGHLGHLFASPPLLYSMNALALPPHLAPKTVPLSGAQFTFIDTGRLKMTLLTLNGKILPRGQVVWSAGTVGEVELLLTNPFLLNLQLTSIALSCRSVASLEDLEDPGNNNTIHGLVHDVGPLAPSNYVVTGVILSSLSTRRLRLQVQPNMSGYLVVDGVEIRLGQLPFCFTLVTPPPQPITLPVLTQLPLISSTLDINEVEIFGGQTIHFPLYFTNVGMVTIQRLDVTAHDKSCQLDSCRGCKQRASTSSLYVLLANASLEENADSSCLNPGDVMRTKVTMISPPGNDNAVLQHIVFRAAVELPHESPAVPPDVPSAVPVFAVIPRRVQETYLRVFETPSVAVSSLAISRNRRYLEVTVKNKNKVHTIELLCSKMLFASIPDALVVAGAEYLIPCIEIMQIPVGMRQFQLPWVVRELPHCHGMLPLDFSIVATMAVCTEPLEDAVVSIKVLPDSEFSFPIPTSQEWRSDTSSTNELPLALSVMKPVSLLLSVRAHWKREVPVRVTLSMENHMDADVLSGPVDTIEVIGGMDGKDSQICGKQFEECFEFFAFKTGVHVLNVKLSDTEEREMVHIVRLCVEAP